MLRTWLVQPWCYTTRRCISVQRKEQLTASKPIRLDVIANAQGNLHELLFKKNMDQKEVKVALFLVEGEIGFSGLNIRKQMTAAIKSENPVIQEWFYQLGIEGRVPANWDDFKQQIVEVYSGKAI